ncbi:hypothetical protein CXF68_01490 [Tenacibaculum sp. Bg11-29]|uniref:hypothetical protein n=1 Tax=Tenacibaculum sp. Bg11-29 TaxID=2058306 RepID=UPI000C31EEF1|nr:hypothetical protein [Tenacibaculum sp. Bg11-29]PKH49437.1 hypothetical protein CXF68_01490 [Tenacibaculum sp. Bg11-29]
MLNLLICFSFISIVLGVPEFITEYHEVSNKKQELLYIKKFQNTTKVAIQGYVISLKMKQAKYKFLPWSKLIVFKKEKKKLENLISKFPKNVHLRYVRLVIQENLPGILNYSSQINSDKEFLKKYLNKKDSTDYLDKYIIKNTSL